MGILNVTPDSFSDGGRYFKAAAAIERARELAKAGAAIIDVGGESTRPGAQPVSPEEEWARIDEVVSALASEGFCVSVDTRHGSVAKRALAAGAAIINDVCGFADPQMVEVVADSDCGCVIVHSRGVPARPSADDAQDASSASAAGPVDAVAEVRDALRDRAVALEAAGVSRERLCLDVGPGFGKSASTTIEVLRNLHEIARLGYPLMAAVSRKSYLVKAYKLDPDLNSEAALAARDEASGAEALAACELGASIVRTHNVAATRAALANLRPYAFLGLGANQAMMGAAGDEEAARESKIAQINLAIAQMCSMPDTQIVDIASFYESEPAYDLDQDRFINTVALIRTGLPPKELLECLHAIEQALGRVRTRPNGPRTIDLDILDYQLYVTDNPTLTLPHPRICERDFVVKPLLELRPAHRLADGTRVGLVPEAERVGRARRL